MTEIVEGVAFVLHTEDNPDCPFCPGKEEKGDWKTWKGADNKASKLRSNMKTPTNLAKIQNKARPKDGEENRQSEDDSRSIYRDGTAIYTHSEYGDYSDQAHHAISGNQILNGHDIEKLTCKSLGIIEKDTGYSVNNCANGICLPAYPNAFLKGNGPLKGKWAVQNADKKVSIMEFPMANNKGQVHIGGHDITPSATLCASTESDAADDSTTDIPHHENYPEIAKKLLQKLYDLSDKNYSNSCGFCEENKKQGKKLPPPYRINQKLDDISKILIGYITGDAASWEYFISTYAQDYTEKLNGIDQDSMGLPPPE